MCSIESGLTGVGDGVEVAVGDGVGVLVGLGVAVSVGDSVNVGAGRGVSVAAIPAVADGAGAAGRAAVRRPAPASRYGAGAPRHAPTVIRRKNSRPKVGRSDLLVIVCCHSRRLAPVLAGYPWNLISL
jgi:hypothetical protein